MSASRGLAAGVAIATMIGGVFGLLYGIVALHVPDLRLHLPNGVSLARTTLFGVLNAQLYFGLWALAFVYPFAVESAGVRALEAQQLRSEAELAHLARAPRAALPAQHAQRDRGPRHRGAARGAPPPRVPRRSAARRGAGDERAPALDKQIAWLRRYAQILEARHHGTLSLPVGRGDRRAAGDAAAAPPSAARRERRQARRAAPRRRSRRGRRARLAPSRRRGARVRRGGQRPRHARRRRARGRVRAAGRAAAPGARGATGRSLRLESSSEGTRSIVEIAQRA